jgi:uncharacterized protein YukE
MQLTDEDFARIAAGTAALIAESEARTATRIAESEPRIQGLLGKSEARTQALIAESEARIQGLLGKSEARTQALIAESEARTQALIAESEARILNRTEGKLDAVESRINDRIAEAIETSATKLLTAFHDWASPMEQRMRTHREAIRALDLQIDEIAGRVKKLEADSETRH